MKTRRMISSNRKDGFSDEMTDEEDKQEVYEVEEIKGHKFENESSYWYVLMKWANYDQPTWEPLVAKNFSNDLRATIKEYAQTKTNLLQTQAWKEFFDYNEMSDNKDKEYEVEGIKGHKFENGSPFVFVKWANHDEVTWESLVAERYSGARTIIKEYAQRHINLKQMQGWKEFFNNNEMTISKDDVYEVEEIKGHKFENESPKGHKFENESPCCVSVKWANYDQPTWEPLVAKNFSNDLRATIKEYAQTKTNLLQTQAWKEFFDYNEMSDNKDKEYEVEGIKGHKFENGSPFVFVKWANHDEVTWEPLVAERYSGARSIIKEYAQNYVDLLQTRGWKDCFDNGEMTGTEGSSEESRKRTYTKWKADDSPPGNAKTNLLPHYSTPPKRNRETIKNKVGRNSNNGSPRRSQNIPVHQSLTKHHDELGMSGKASLYTERCDDRSKDKRKFDEDFTNAVGSEEDNAVEGLEHHNNDNNDTDESKENEDFKNAFRSNDNNDTDESKEHDNDDEFQNDPDEEEIPALEKLDINDDTDNNWDGNVDLREGFLKDHVGSISTDIDSIYLIGRSLESMLKKTTLGTEAYLGALMINRYVNMMPLQTTRHSIRIKLDDHTRSKKVPLHKFPGILLAMVDLGNPSIRFSIN